MTRTLKLKIVKQNNKTINCKGGTNQYGYTRIIQVPINYVQKIENGFAFINKGDKIKVLKAM
jgi:hypothetical protein